MPTTSRKPEPALSLRWSGKSDTGPVRKNNEDAFLGVKFDGREAWHLGRFGEASLAAHDYAFAVSDGMGGENAGEFASRITVEKIMRLLPRAYAQSATGMRPGFADVLTELFDQVHRALRTLGQSYEECRGMGATLTLGWFTPSWLYFAHIGDSRLYYLPHDGPIRQLTEDDTYVGWLFRTGQINEREAKNHPRRNVLQRALGADHRYTDPQLGSVELRPGDRFLLCTDGVADALFDARLDEYAREDGDDLADRLVANAIAASGRDNTTALIVAVK